ncbi:FCD domain-containing protein [Thalassococcus sp. CAU 1522]|uniref:FCD domain-containing protein n=1 Tax=Thalassococcus arenae TaxID=2851652 RepID=A0ABS6NBZ3_9RHOB|nr:FCD domain-containing protein [Thalassococcus arenae]MBV2361540.1 FCD domain-containing protein [Thalassococcus arenae]
MPASAKATGVADLTARQIEDLILEGSLRSGEPLLSEREMAERLQVSRPTLRQSLKLLEERGLIVSGPDGSKSVARLAVGLIDPLMALIATRPDISDNYLELRATLERMAATLAATRATDVDRDALRACVARIEAAHGLADPAAEAEADLDLHVTVYEACHNAVLLQIMRALIGMLRQGVFLNRERLYALPEVRETLRNQHIAIVDGILARDPEAAGAAAEAHMIYTREVLAEIASAEKRLQVSLRRIAGGDIAQRKVRSGG